MTLDTRKIHAFRFCNAPDEKATTEILFEDGTKIVEGFIVHKPNTNSKNSVIEQLGLEMTANGDIKVKSPIMDTSVYGVFAAGDCAGALKQVVIAVSQGLTTAAGINAQLAGEQLL